MANFYVQKEIDEIPSYMLDPDKFGYFQQSGQMKDDINSAAQDAIQNSFVKYAPVDALDKIGNTFNITKPQPMNYEAYRAKLDKHWDYWRTSGTPNRLLTEIHDYGFPNVAIIPEWIEVTPGNWVKSLPITDPKPQMDLPIDPESGTGWWSNFWVVIRLPHSFTARLWGSAEAGKWGIGGTDGTYLWGSIAGNQAVLASLKALIRKLKPAWSSCRGIVFGLAGFPAWGDFEWGDGTVWGLLPNTYGVEFVREPWEFISLF